MADPKRGSPTRRGTDVPEGTARVVDPAMPDQLLALVVILSQNIAKIRLFDSTDRARVLFETGLPASRDSLAAPEYARERAFFATLEERFVEPFFTTRPSEPHPDPVAAALKTLLSPADPAVASSALTGETLGVQAPGFDTPFEAYTDPSSGTWISTDPAPLRYTHLDPIRQRATALDVVFHRPNRTWRVELSPLPESPAWSAADLPAESTADLPAESRADLPAESAAELRGESLDELRRKAPPLPVQGETPPADAYFTAPAAAKYLGVDRSTITRRVGSNQLIGFTVFKRTLRIPKDQFLESDVVPGVPEVLALFPKPVATSNNPIDHRSAWAFLAGDLFHGDPEPRPIDRLRVAAAKGMTELVLADLARAKESLDRGDHL